MGLPSSSCRFGIPGSMRSISVLSPPGEVRGVRGMRGDMGRSLAKLERLVKSAGLVGVTQKWRPGGREVCERGMGGGREVRVGGR